MRHASLFVIVLCTLLIAGCAKQRPLHAYSGPEQPEDTLLRVEIPPTLKTLAIDEEKDKPLGSLLSDGPRTLFLLPGEHTLSVVYESVWQVTADDHEVVRSAPVTVTIDGAPGDTITLLHEDDHTLAMAREIAAQPVIRSARQRAHETETDSPAIAPAVATITPAASALAITEAEHLMHGAGTVSEPTSASDIAGSDNALEQLKYWWQNASAEERQTFQRWVYER